MDKAGRVVHKAGEKVLGQHGGGMVCGGAVSGMGL